MSWQYQPAGKADALAECFEKQCALWTGLECAIVALAKRR